MLTLPCCLIGSMANVQAGSKLLEHRCGEVLDEDLGVLGCCRDMENPNLTEGNVIPNKVEIDLNMFCAFMLNRIGGGK